MLGGVRLTRGRLVHLAVVEEHFDESALFGIFFVVAGALQIGWAMVALWAVTRTVGLPVGPEVWTPEAVGRADVLCIALEVVSAGAVVAWLAPSRTGERPVRAGRYLLLVGAGALAVACMTTPALAATGAESSHGEEMGH